MGVSPALEASTATSWPSPAWTPPPTVPPGQSTTQICDMKFRGNIFSKLIQLTPELWKMKLLLLQFTP